ncbi:MAG TPA: hypothetical protein VHT51_03715 [Micropepsaceae bacterium]|jgi:hypothetical protein|nr:hypothetical protein [Micropepsaceae bacterium]
MSDTVQNQNDTKKSGISVQTILIGVAVVLFAALIAYQMFGCATCYG